jgi:hypothetical protein
LTDCNRTIAPPIMGTSKLYGIIQNSSVKVESPSLYLVHDHPLTCLSPSVAQCVHNSPHQSQVQSPQSLCWHRLPNLQIKIFRRKQPLSNQLPNHLRPRLSFLQNQPRQRRLHSSAKLQVFSRHSQKQSQRRKAQRLRLLQSHLLLLTKKMVSSNPHTKQSVR